MTWMDRDMSTCDAMPGQARPGRLRMVNSVMDECFEVPIMPCPCHMSFRSKRDILVSLIEKDWQVFLRGVQVPYLRDVYDHLVIMLHELDAGMELLEAIQVRQINHVMGCFTDAESCHVMTCVCVR